MADGDPIPTHIINPKDWPNVAQLQRETLSSIELQRAKDGTYYWTLKIYFNPEEEPEAVTTLDLLAYIDKKLKDLFVKGE